MATETGRESLIARPSGRSSSRLVVSEQGRKPLFSGASSKPDETAGRTPGTGNGSLIPTPRTNSQRASIVGDNLLRRASSDARGGAPSLQHKGSNSSLTSSGGTRIPKLKGNTLSNRKTLSLADAWDLAGQDDEEDDDDQTNVMDASPSPAPRQWRARREDDGNKARKALDHDHLDTKGQARPFSRESLVASPLAQTKISPQRTESPRRRNFYGKTRPGIGSSTAAQETTEGKENGADSKSNNTEELQVKPQSGPDWYHRSGGAPDFTGEGRIPALVPGIEDLPYPSIENGEQRPAPSPEKSFAWQVDEDFTAGDLQISDSPRISMGGRPPFANRINFDDGSEVDINSRTRVAPPGSLNTKLDGIRSREVKSGSNIPLPSPRRPQKVDEIKSLEAQVESQIPIPDRSLPRPKNTKLPDIQQREKDGISARKYAQIRLGEIKEQNLLSRSISPEEARPQTSLGAVPETKLTAELETEKPERPKSAFEVGGERIPDTPVVVYKTRPSTDAEAAEPAEDGEEIVVARNHGHKREDSRGLLRQLARATSASPAPEPAPAPETFRAPDAGDAVTGNSDPQTTTAAITTTNTTTTKPATTTTTETTTTGEDAAVTTTVRRAATDNVLRHALRRAKDRNRDKNKDGEVHRVGFAGIPRSRSTDSVKSKRSSMNSEIDPSDRIDSELQLFAPADNHSERGSIRAPSPMPDSGDEKDAGDKDVEATPRPLKPDPLSMPTPKVTGAYVETPATVKVIKREDVRDDLPPRPRSSASLRDKKPDLGLGGRSRSESAGGDPDTASDHGTDEQAATRTSSAGVRRRRARSLPRRRGPLKNTAKLPSVKDDLLELKRTHHIDDSTLDDLEEVLLGRKAPSPKMQALLQDLPEQLNTYDSFDFELDLDRELDTKMNTRNNKRDRSSSQPDLLGHEKKESPNGELAAFDRMTKSLQTGLMGIHKARQGIERLEGQISNDTKAAAETKTATMMDEKATNAHTHHHHHHHDNCTSCTMHTGPASSYIRLPIPQLYRRKPSFRFTFLGLVVFALTAWYAMESAMCAMYCRPTVCSTTPCVWSIDDPNFGTAIPVKLDQWATGGQGRVLADALWEEAEDWVADLADLYHGRDITDVDASNLSFGAKRQHRRRLRKKGLLRSPEVAPEERAKLEAWRQTARARERVREAREMGYHVEDEGDQSVGGDRRVG